MDSNQKPDEKIAGVGGGKGAGVSGEKVCIICGRPAMHFFYRWWREPFDFAYCCKHYIEIGGLPSDWHKECMEIKNNKWDDEYRQLLPTETTNLAKDGDAKIYGGARGGGMSGSLYGEHDSLPKEENIWGQRIGTVIGLLISVLVYWFLWQRIYDETGFFTATGVIVVLFFVDLLLNASKTLVISNIKNRLKIFRSDDEKN